MDIDFEPHSDACISKHNDYTKTYKPMAPGIIKKDILKSTPGLVIPVEEPKNIISNPSHYTQGSIQPVDVIIDWKLDFCLGNAIKYIARCNHKGNKEQDLRKAIQYLEFELEKVK